MTLAELMPSIEALPRSEKLYLIQLLATDVARHETIADDTAGKAVPIWSPYDSFQGAAALLNAINADKATS